MSTSTAQAGAIHLLEKYTALNRCMDDARSENARIQSEKETIRQEIERLEQERVDMEAQTVQARDESSTLHKDVQDALVKCTELEKRHAQALLEKMEARRQLDLAKTLVEQQRQDFLEQSRDFRTTCKRMRLSASAVGEDMATSKAFLKRHNVSVNWSDNDGSEGGDAELQQVLSQHARWKAERDEAERALQDTQAREKLSAERASTRLERKNQLRAQLERVRRDNTEAENHLKDLDQQTREAREMAHNFEKGRLHIEYHVGSLLCYDLWNAHFSSCRHHATLLDMNRRLVAQRRPSHSSVPSVTPGTVPRSQQQSRPLNPYAANTRMGSNRARAPAPRQQQPVGVGRAWDSNEAQPHLMTRRRPFDRQFGSTALDIISGRETNENDDSLMFPPESNAEPTYKAINNPATSILLDSSDDDDDELFGDSVFSKK